MSGTKQFACPLDGCDYRSGTKGSVKAHITRKTDSVHAGLSGPKFGDRIKASDVDGDRDGAGDVDGDRDGAGDVDGDRDGADRSVRSSASVDGADVDGAGIVPREHRVPSSTSTTTDSGQCCDSPDLAGTAGDFYRLESGEVVRLESGDQICLNCDSLHE